MTFTQAGQLPGTGGSPFSVWRYIVVIAAISGIVLLVTWVRRRKASLREW
jgi:hypothetical protein